MKEFFQFKQISWLRVKIIVVTTLIFCTFAGLVAGLLWLASETPEGNAELWLGYDEIYAGTYLGYHNTGGWNLAVIASPKNDMWQHDFEAVMTEEMKNSLKPGDKVYLMTLKMVNPGGWNFQAFLLPREQAEKDIVNGMRFRDITKKSD